MSRILKDIRHKCLDCCGHSAAEVRACGIKACSLHPYRMGTNPFRKPRELSAAQRIASAERLAKGANAGGPNTAYGKDGAE